MNVRSAEDLARVDEPAWPAIKSLVEQSSSRARILPVDRATGEASLHRLQVTAASTLGALALNCGGLLVDGGWVRILGGGYDGLPSIATANGLNKPTATKAPWPYLTVAFDVLGGRFAIDGGGLGVSPGKVCYWAPDSLEWEGTDLGHGAFVQAFITGVTTKFYEDFRWPGWTDDVATLGLDQGLSLWPPPFSTEGRDLATVSRRPVPLSELHSFYEDAARQL